MHELSVCRALLEQVVRTAIEYGASSVVGVRVRIGPLSGVDPSLLATAYPHVTAGTLAAASLLTINRTSLTVLCQACGHETAAEPSRLMCGACGSVHTQLVGGDELELESIEFVTPAREAEPTAEARYV